MQKYQKVYLDFFGYDESDSIPSEISGNPANDIHHIKCKGMGGSKTKDNIENLIALTRKEHEMYGDKKQYLDFLTETHLNFIKTHKR